jgi:glycerol-3-phosphate acyltransferase PlsY
VRAAAWLFASYLVGAIPTGYLAGRLFRGIDLRQYGSRNPGATNVYRVLGWKYAVPVALVDVAKGALPVLLFGPRISPAPLVAAACGVAAVAGHALSPFLGFRGGKGVATAAGAMLALAPAAIGACALLWAGLVWVTGYVSVASVTAAVALPVAVALLEPAAPRGLVWVSAALAAAVVWLHRANIRRLRAGTENRFRRRPAAPPAG